MNQMYPLGRHLVVPQAVQFYLERLPQYLPVLLQCARISAHHSHVCCLVVLASGALRLHRAGRHVEAQTAERWAHLIATFFETENPQPQDCRVLGYQDLLRWLNPKIYFVVRLEPGVIVNRVASRVAVPRASSPSRALHIQEHNQGRGRPPPVVALHVRPFAPLLLDVELELGERRQRQPVVGGPH